jgi:hypothetical protein
MVSEFGDFIQANSDVLFGWMNLDVIGNEVESRSNAQYLKDRNLAPIEVWHCGDSIEVQNFHFLGGGGKLLNHFDWFSADSTSWLACRKYGAVIDAEGQHKAPKELQGIEAMAIICSYLSSMEKFVV